MSDAWDPATYEKFARQRAKPFHDLVGLLTPARRPSVVDMGCGTGALTLELAGATGASSVLGIDNSTTMLATSPTDPTGITRFIEGDVGSPEIAALTGGSVDIVFSNAALQWIPSHTEVLARWAALVKADGQLAVQIPANGEHPSHVVAHEVAAAADFAELWTGDAPHNHVRDIRSPAEYAEILFEAGFPEPHVRLSVYPHLMDSSRSVLEWVRGTALTPFRSRLSDEAYREFERRYERRLIEEIGDRSPYFYAFSRILMWGGNRSSDSISS